MLRRIIINRVLCKWTPFDYFVGKESWQTYKLVAAQYCVDRRSDTTGHVYEMLHWSVHCTSWYKMRAKIKIKTKVPPVNRVAGRNNKKKTNWGSMFLLTGSNFYYKYCSQTTLFWIIKENAKVGSSAAEVGVAVRCYMRHCDINYLQLRCHAFGESVRSMQQT